MSTHMCPPNMDHSRDVLTQNRHNPLTTSSTTYSLSSAPSRFFGSEMTTPSEITPKSSRKNVARNLFGPPDPRSSQYARDKVIEMRGKDIERWNFDFDKEKPLEGRYKWEAVSIGNESRGEGSSECHIPRPYALSRLPFLASSTSSLQSPSTSSSSADGLFSKSESLFVVYPKDCASRWGGAAGGTASDVGGSGESEGEERRVSHEEYPTPGSSASAGTSLTRSSSQESQSASSGSSQYSLPSPSPSSPVQIDPLTIPIPSPPEDCSSSSSASSTSEALPLPDEPTTTPPLQQHDSKVRLKKRTAKQTTMKDFMPVKRRSTSQTTGVPEKKAAI